MKIEIGFFPAIIAGAIYLGGLFMILLYVIHSFNLAAVQTDAVLNELQKLL